MTPDRQAWIADFGDAEDGEDGPAIGALPRSQRRAYVSVELNGNSVHEHAEVSGKSVEAVRSALRQARDALGGSR